MLITGLLADELHPVLVIKIHTKLFQPNKGLTCR
jgi:hypothetical protein